MNLFKCYEQHNQNIRDYFKGREKDFLVFNVARSDGMKNLCHFLEKPYTGQGMPWENKT